MMERFLERISLSEYKNQFILKGRMLMAAMVGLDARATMDLDATIKGTNVSVEDVEMIVSKIISIPLNDGVSFRIKRISEIMEEADYPGVRVSMEIKFDGAITPLKIDISTGDIITPREIKNNFNLMLEKQVLWNALVATARKRGTLEQINSGDIREIFDEIEISSVMENLWKAYQKNYYYAANISWQMVMQSIRFLYEISYNDNEAITKWETNKGIPDIANLIAISDELGLSLDELIKDDVAVKKKIITDSSAKKWHILMIVYLVAIVAYIVYFVICHKILMIGFLVATLFMLFFELRIFIREKIYRQRKE